MDHVEIRALDADDGPALAAAFRRNREHLAPYQPPRPESFFTDLGQAERIATQLDSEPTYLAWDGERVVGRVALSNVVGGPLQSCSLGYWVDRDRQGQGLASRLVARVVEHARGLGLHRVEAGTFVDNLASQRVLERNGFARFGLAEGYLFIDGSWRDHLLFQLLLHDEPPT